MAIRADERDILDVFLITNLSAIANNSPFLNEPAGMQSFIDTITIDNVSSIPFPSDLRDLLVNYILVNQFDLDARQFSFFSRRFKRSPQNPLLRQFGAQKTKTRAISEQLPSLSPLTPLPPTT